MPFDYVYSLGGGLTLIQSLAVQDTETFHKGDMANIESGLVDLAVTSDAALVGAVQGAFDPADELTPGVITAITAVTKVKFIANPDAVYEVTDANARLAGALLDITGTTGAQLLAASSNTEFVVIETSTASEKTKVMILPDSNVFIKGQ